MYSQVFTYSGQNSSHPAGAASSSFSNTDSSGDNCACGAITTSYAYSKVVGLLFYESSSSASGTTLSSYEFGSNAATEEYSNAGQIYLGNYELFAIFDLVQASAGSTGAFSVSTSNLPYSALKAAIFEIPTS